ncbi:MAG: folylpolyglutamate synthase/dihydrofolate synthase family protein [Chloroflexota bacterium]
MSVEESDPRYQAVLAHLAARGRFGIRLGLGRTRALLARLGDPHVGLPGVLIGGTNGKGSTQALVASVLREGGILVGQTPKPHLVSYRERIVVDGRPIAVEDFTNLLAEVLEQADFVARKHGPPTEFEVLTAAAFLWFKRSGVEVGVIEVGLGGRLDATNAWQGGVSAITNVALDHMEHLGNTIEAIAREKAAIMKRGDSYAVTGASEPALRVIRARSRRVGVQLDVREPLEVVGMDLDGVRVREHDLRIGLLGGHQAANASVALGILGALERANIAYAPPAQLERGFANARWPGRLEFIRVEGHPQVLLDGAHNPHGVAALAQALIALQRHLGDATPTLLMGVLANHWQDGMLDPLKSAVPGARFVATNVPGAPNSMPPADLAAAWGSGATPIDDTDKAFDTAAAKASGTLVVCGSLYLVGYLRAKLVGADL